MMATSKRKSHGSEEINQDSNSNLSVSSTSNDGSMKGTFNTFVNDASFLEKLKRKLNSNTSNAKVDTDSGSEKYDSSSDDSAKKKKNFVLVGKRKGGKVLKTGIVAKKTKVSSDEDSTPSDALSRYMAEVKKYRQISGKDEDDSSRPLVK